MNSKDTQVLESTKQVANWMERGEEGVVIDFKFPGWNIRDDNMPAIQ